MAGCQARITAPGAWSHVPRCSWRAPCAGNLLGVGELRFVQCEGGRGGARTPTPAGGSLRGETPGARGSQEGSSPPSSPVRCPRFPRITLPSSGFTLSNAHRSLNVQLSVTDLYIFIFSMRVSRELKTLQWAPCLLGNAFQASPSLVYGGFPIAVDPDGRGWAGPETEHPLFKKSFIL